MKGKLIAIMFMKIKLTYIGGRFKVGIAEQHNNTAPIR